jgi:hypothetical protein
MSFVYIRNKGGIGNQLFVYNFGVLISSKTNFKLLIDNTTGFLKDKYGRIPKLDLIFKPKPNEASVLLKVIFLVVRKLPIRFLNFLKIDLLIELDTKTLVNTDQYLNNKNKFLFIEGYFQSYQYVLPNKNYLVTSSRLDFDFNNSYNEYFSQINSTNSVCLHVRRDSYDNYLSNIYYENAIKLICESSINPVFFVFSDSLEWCRENIKAENIVFIDVKKNLDDIQEFFLMSKCKNFIVANSSFSWWPAFLALNPSKLVIAPINNQIGVKDKFFPENWIKI